MQPPADVARLIEDAGRRTNNFRLVESLRAALSSGEHAYRMVPMLTEEVIEEEAWMARIDPNGHPIDLGSGEFLRFIEAPAPEGLGTSQDTFAQYLDGPVRLLFHATIRRSQGNPVGRHDPQRHPDGTYSSNTDNIRVTGEERPKPDRSREPQGGTSIGATVRRFEKEAPRDEAIAAIYEDLKAGKLSANAAAVAAGWRPKSITVPAVPALAGRRLTLHFTRQQFGEMVDAALDAYGVTRPDKIVSTETH